MKEVNIFKYVDPRAYMKDCQKAGVHPMTESYRGIAKRIGIGGPYLWLVMHGQKPFSKKIIDNFPGILPINDNQMKYLKLLMHLANVKMDMELRNDVINKFRPAQYHKAVK